MLPTIVLAACGLFACAAILIALLVWTCAPVIDDDTIAQREEGGPQ